MGGYQPYLVLSLAAALFVALQAVTVEHGIAEARKSTSTSSAIAATLASIVVSVIIFWLLFIIRDDQVRNITIWSLTPFIIAGALDPMAFRLLYFEGIERTGARLSATIIALNPAVVALFAVLFLGEQISSGIGFGIVCILYGGIILQFSQNSAESTDLKREKQDLLVRELANVNLQELIFPAAAMLILALAKALIKFGLNRTPDPVLAAVTSQTTALVIFAGLFVASSKIRQQAYRPSWRTYSFFILAGIFVAFSWLLQFTALRLGNISTVIPLVNTFPIIVIAISYLTAREYPKSPHVIGAIVAIILGIVFIQVF